VLYRDNALVVPAKFRTQIMQELHVSHGSHLGYDKILPVLQRRAWWQGMARDLKEFCRACIMCARTSPYNSERQGMLRPIVARLPWEMIAVDLKGPLPLGRDDERYVLAVMDYFSKFVVLIPIRRKFAAVVADEFEAQILNREGIPKTVVTDGGSEFRGEFAELMKKHHIDHQTTLPYHHQANGLIERFMQSINKMVKIVAATDKKAWHTHLSKLAFAYNTSFHPATGDTPYWIANFRDPRLSLDNAIGSEGRDGKTRTLQQRDALWRLVQDNLWTAAERAKSFYDASQRDLKLKCGDLVFVKRAVVENKTQLLWSDLHRVQESSEDGLRVLVKPYAQDGKPQWVSIQRIRKYEPYDRDSTATSEQEPPLPEPIGLKEALTGVDHASTAESSPSSDEEESESSDDENGTASPPSCRTDSPVVVERIPPSASPAEEVCTEAVGSAPIPATTPSRVVVSKEGGESTPTAVAAPRCESPGEVEPSTLVRGTPTASTPPSPLTSEGSGAQRAERESPDAVEIPVEPIVTEHSDTPAMPTELASEGGTPTVGAANPDLPLDPAFAEYTPSGQNAYYHVEEIVDAKCTDGRVMFEIKWRGHAETSWVDYEEVVERDLVQEYADRRYAAGAPKVRTWEEVEDHFGLRPWPKRRRRAPRSGH